MNTAQTERTARILLVEDQWPVAFTLGAQLELARYTVIGPAASLSEAMDLIGRERLDAALLDVDLNGQSSYPAAAMLRQMDVPFAFLSGFNAAHLDPAFRDAQLICKMVPPAEIVAALGELLTCARRSAPAVSGAAWPRRRPA